MSKKYAKDLRPCPICGGKGKLKVKLGAKLEMFHIRPQVCYIQCEKCHARTANDPEIMPNVCDWNMGRVYTTRGNIS